MTSSADDALQLDATVQRVRNSIAKQLRQLVGKRIPYSSTPASLYSAFTQVITSHVSSGVISNGYVTDIKTVDQPRFVQVEDLPPDAEPGDPLIGGDGQYDGIIVSVDGTVAGRGTVFRAERPAGAISPDAEVVITADVQLNFPANYVQIEFKL